MFGFVGRTGAEQGLANYCCQPLLAKWENAGYWCWIVGCQSVGGTNPSAAVGGANTARNWFQEVPIRDNDCKTIKSWDTFDWTNWAAGRVELFLQLNSINGWLVASNNSVEAQVELLSVVWETITACNVASCCYTENLQSLLSITEWINTRVLILATLEALQDGF